MRNHVFCIHECSSSRSSTNNQWNCLWSIITWTARRNSHPANQWDFIQFNKNGCCRSFLHYREKFYPNSNTQVLRSGLRWLLHSDIKFRSKQRQLRCICLYAINNNCKIRKNWKGYLCVSFSCIYKRVAGKYVCYICLLIQNHYDFTKKHVPATLYTKIIHTLEKCKLTLSLSCTKQIKSFRICNIKTSILNSSHNNRKNWIKVTKMSLVSNSHIYYVTPGRDRMIPR